MAPSVTNEEDMWAGIDDAQILVMEASSRVVNTDRNTTSWLGRFEAYCKVVCPDKELFEMSIEKLQLHLRKFFTGLRKIDGTEYKTKNIHNCLAALNRHIKENYDPNNPLDIMNDPRFAGVRRVIDGKMKNITKQGGLRTEGSSAITEEEQRILLNSPGYSRDTAAGLVHRVHFWIGLYGAVRGQQHAQLTLDMIERRNMIISVLYSRHILSSMVTCFSFFMLHPLSLRHQQPYSYRLPYLLLCATLIWVY
ncbi:hypothetical protein BJV82DRAFT_676601 [Fennellomyces sp. T-0311]|nr:hypothetical protein BJV82DRAFT_676601 [Fennellomyces sp. T-0311]